MDALHRWFANPWALWLLSVGPVLGIIAIFTARSRRRALLQLGAFPAMDGLVATGRGLRFLRGFCRSTALSLLILGIAGPQWGRDWGQSATSGRDLVVVLDASRSMFARDVLPNRLGRARAAAAELVEQTVSKRAGHRVALVVFAARPRVFCPLTTDYRQFLEVLKQVDLDGPPADLLPENPGESGTRVGAALLEAVRVLRPDNEPGQELRGYQDILLLSDGDDPASDSASERRAGVARARDAHIPVHTVGLGNPDAEAALPFAYEQPVTSHLHETPLRDIARATNGTYTPARQKALALGPLFSDCIEREPGEEALPVYEQHADPFLGGALGFLALEMLLGRWRRRPAERSLYFPVVVLDERRSA